MFERTDLSTLLSVETIQEFSEMFTELSVPAKTILLEQGKQASKVYWIKKGCIRAWLESEGEEITFQFFTENSLVSSIESFWTGKPSTFTLETVETCELLVADKSNIQLLIEKALENEKYRNAFINVIFDRTFDYIQHSVSFIKLTPEQRYLKFAVERPNLVQRIPQYLIASYLGITKVHLSRIKSKLAKQ